VVEISNRLKVVTLLVVFFVLNGEYLRMHLGEFVIVGAVVDRGCTAKCRSLSPNNTNACGLETDIHDCISAVRHKLRSVDAIDRVIVNSENELVFLGVGDRKELSAILRGADFEIVDLDYQTKVGTKPHLNLLMISFAFLLFFYRFILFLRID